MAVREIYGVERGFKRQELLDAFRQNELSYDLWDSIEELEQLAGPQENFRRIARDFATETRSRVLELVKQGIGDPHVQGRIFYALRLADEALCQERAEVKVSKFPGLRTVNSEVASIERDLDAFARYLHNFKRDIANLAAEAWRRAGVNERERRAKKANNPG